MTDEEKAARRPSDYATLTPQEQAEVDKLIETLDWGGTAYDPDNLPLTSEQLNRMMHRSDWDLARGIVSLLPDDKVTALKILDGARRLVERRK